MGNNIPTIVLIGASLSTVARSRTSRDRPSSAPEGTPAAVLLEPAKAEDDAEVGYSAKRLSKGRSGRAPPGHRQAGSVELGSRLHTPGVCLHAALRCYL
jgi:hypothetical protein